VSGKKKRKGKAKGSTGRVQGQGQGKGQSGPWDGVVDMNALAEGTEVKIDIIPVD
jgi:hypothetical protein